MLVNRAVICFEIWTAVAPDAAVVREALEEYLEFQDKLPSSSHEWYCGQFFFTMALSVAGRLRCLSRRIPCEYSRWHQTINAASHPKDR